MLLYGDIVHFVLSIYSGVVMLCDVLFYLVFACLFWNVPESAQTQGRFAAAMATAHGDT
jgi:hypothetical protein